MSRPTAAILLSGTLVLAGIFCSMLITIPRDARAAIPEAAAQASVGAADHDWPQWRGPNRDGVSLDTGLIKKWPEDGPPLLYAFRGEGEKGCGSGFCPPTVVGNRAYLSGKFDGNRTTEAWLMAFELPKYDTLKPAAADEMPILGKMLWKAKYGASVNSGENAAPTVVGDHIFITSGDGDIAAFNTDGKLLWSHNMRKDFNAHVQTNASYGFSESPLVDGDKVIVCPGTADAVMVAYNKNTGELLWKCANPEGGPRDSASHSSTMLSNGGGVKQYVNLTGWGLVGVSPEGKFLWGYKRTCESSCPSPIIRGDYVFALSSYGFGAVMMKLAPSGDGGVKSTLVYQLKSEECETLCGQAVLVGDSIYHGNGKYAGIPQSIDFLTGKKNWRASKQIGAGGAYVIAYEDMIIYRNESKQVLLVEATPKGYNLVSQFVPISHKNADSPPVIAHGLLYLRDGAAVMVYDLHQR